MRQNTKHNPFLGSLRAVAIAIGKRAKIDIKFEGAGAKTNGSTIYLPAALPADDEEIEIMLRGFLDHEVGHVKHTDFGIPEPPLKLIHTITNIVEDIRIEQLMGREYPGCAVNMRELIDYLKSIGKIRFKDKASATGATLMAISYGARVKHLRNNLVEEADGYRKLAAKHLGKKALSVIDTAIAKAGCLTSTQEAQNLAMEVYDLLKQLSEEPPPPPQTQQSEKPEQNPDNNDQQEEGQGGQGKPEDEKGGDKGDQEDQTGEGSGDDAQGNEGQNDSSADGAGGEDDDNDNDDDGAGDGTAGGEGNNDPSDSDDSSAGGNGAGSQEGDESSNPSNGKPLPGPTPKQRQNLDGLLNASESELEQTGNDLDVSAQAADQINRDNINANMDGRRAQVDSSGNTGEVGVVRTGSFGDGSYIQNLAQKTVGFRGKLSGLFQSTKLKRDNPQLSGYKLDRRATHRLAAMTPDARIFQRRQEKVADNTAIAIVVDRSGSMRDDIGLATASAYSVVKATESMPGVTCTVAAFPHSNGNVFGLKDFSEKSNPARFAIGASGGTPLDVGLRWAGQKLWPRRENRKMVLVLTDGEPDDFHKATGMVEMLLQCNIECYGIGIGCGTGPMVRSLFGEHSKEISTIEELPKAMFDTLTNAMTRR